jgi:hypothetical protein
MEVSANVRRAEPTPRREQDGETYSAATRSRSTSTQPIAAPSTATHTSCSRIARATRSAAPRVAHRSACSLDIAGTASARMARRRILASACSSAASARRICIKSLPRGLAVATSHLRIHPLIPGRRFGPRHHRDSDGLPRTGQHIELLGRITPAVDSAFHRNERPGWARRVTRSRALRVAVSSTL